MAPKSPNKPDQDTLRKLYVDERLTTRQIGRRYDVAHITIRRWLAGYEIPLRPKGQGLAYRGITAPTTEELNDLVHVQHLGYREIAALYGVDYTAVPYWLDRHGISRPDPWVQRRRGRTPCVPSADEIRHRRALGESVTLIAASCNVGRAVILGVCRANGIPVDRDGWNGGHRYVCLDGHEARSLYEQRVDDWLTRHGLQHEVEPTYPFEARYRADFLVGGYYVEVWGVVYNDAYTARKRKKIHLCEQHAVPLIQINHWQFAKGRQWWRPLERLLENLAPEQTQLCDDLWDVPIERGT